MKTPAVVTHAVMVLLGALLCAIAAAPGAVRVPRLISEGMVLQRDAEIRVWGWASPGETVTVRFLGHTRSTKAPADSSWELLLPPLKSGGPYAMEIEGTNRIVIGDILIGDVWVCSGQSNMELPMRRVAPKYPEEIAGANNPSIRQFVVPQTYDFVRSHDDVEQGTWTSATPRSVLDFSAVAYFFAVEMYAHDRIPIGLINASLGGAPAEAFMSEHALQSFPNHLKELRRFKDQAVIDSVTRSDAQRMFQWYQALREKDAGYASGSAWTDPSADTRTWSAMTIPGYWDTSALGPVHGVVWFRRSVVLRADMAGQPACLLLGRIIDADSVFVNGVCTGATGYQYPPRRYAIAPGVLKEGINTIVVRVINTAGRGGFVPGKPYVLSIGGREIDLTGPWLFRLGASMDSLPDQTFIRWKPSGLFNAMIAPLRKYRIAGVIWYQGESNVSAPGEYRTLFPTLIRDWRTMWGEGEFPFLFVQLANYLEARPEPVASSWAALRDAQREALCQPRTAMAVTIDIGEWNDIHPVNKKDVGIRLALAARHVASGDTAIVWSGPLYTSMAVEHDSIRIRFSNTGSGLLAKTGKELREFTIAGPDRRFVRACARIDGRDVIVWSSAVSHPVAVRYAWADNPEGANLYNREGLPASPLRTDDWPTP